jgi:putative Mg2+ transporter-C (MgtC) family protein
VDFIEIEMDRLLALLLRLLAAFLITLPVAWNRERSTRAMGLRTFPLVAVASCGFVLLGRVVLAESVDAQARIISGLMTGIGFIGGGAILKYEGSVYGTATAASIWSTGLIGAAVAYDRYEIAILVSLLSLGLLLLLQPLKRGIHGEDVPENDMLRLGNGDDTAPPAT